MTLEKMKEDRTILWKNFCSSAKIYFRAKSLYESTKKRYERDRDLWEKADYALALLDGRKQVIEEKRKLPSRPRARSLGEMTREEIVALAKKFGITVVDHTPEIEVGVTPIQEITDDEPLDDEQGDDDEGREVIEE